MTTYSRIAWTKRFISLGAGLATPKARACLLGETVPWIVVIDESRVYACSREELLALLERVGPAETVGAILAGAGQIPSLTCRLQDMPLRIRNLRHAPTSADRYVLVNGERTPVAVGGLDVEEARRERGRPDAAFGLDTSAATVLGTGLAAGCAGKGVPSSIAQDEIEARSPRRFPSIEAETPLLPGQPLTLVVDLLRSPSPSTIGTAPDLETESDWTSIGLDVILTSPHIHFEQDGYARITIRRADNSIPARVEGHLTVRQDFKGSIVVSAQFMHGTRLAGLAMRIFERSCNVSPPPASAGWPAATVGNMHIEQGAPMPDVTVYIAASDPERPYQQHWQISTTRFDGLPSALAGSTTLASDAVSELVAMLKGLAALEPGRHQATIEGFGEQLWERAPAVWKEAYWALWDYYRRPFSIQFISDDPYLPWELMRPNRGRDMHPPLALMHPVGRWIRRWDGYMRSRLPSGQVYTIAPRYRNAGSMLRHAEKESQALGKRYGAVRIDGTYDAVKQLFESAPAPPVAVLHFAGHGSFVPDNAGASFLTLEDGHFSVFEAARRDVMLGVACRTLVIFNACEVGATGTAMGAVGGWAQALLSREFGGFIAPLWAVEDADAATVTEELLHGVLNCGQPVAEVLRDIRQRYGMQSPTFYSYLYYGDVTARVTPMHATSPAAN